MSRVLVTGMSGVGKSTLLEGLARRGYTVLDTDYDGWVLADGRWDEARMSDLLDRVTSIVVSGTVENQAKFYDRFDHILLLSAPNRNAHREGDDADLKPVRQSSGRTEGDRALRRNASAPRCRRRA
jgi:adenylate kinase family enzyme